MMLLVRAVLDPSALTLRIARPFFPRGAAGVNVKVDNRTGESALLGSRRRACMRVPKSSSGSVNSAPGSGEPSSSRSSCGVGWGWC